MLGEEINAHTVDVGLYVDHGYAAGMVGALVEIYVRSWCYTTASGRCLAQEVAVGGALCQDIRLRCHGDDFCVERQCSGWAAF